MRLFRSILTLLSLTVFLSWAAPQTAGQEPNDNFNFNEALGNEFEEEEEDELSSDRDSFTRSPRLMKPGRALFELSYTFFEQGPADDGQLFPDLLVRYGTTQWLELRLGWNYEISKFAHLAETQAEPVEKGIINYGGKFSLTTACGWRPESSVIVTGYTPTSGESNHTDFSLEYVFGWTFGGGWELDGMVRWFSLAEEEDRFSEWAPSVVLKRGIFCGRANVHVEYFSLNSVNRGEEYRQHYAGSGVHYLITPDMEIGVRVFWGLSDDAAQFVANTGVALRY